MILLSATTDWVSAVGTLVGIPVAAWGIIKLFIKDKDQIQRLKFIEEQVGELRKQTSQFEMQTQIMAEANQLLEKQIEFQSEIYLETKTKEDAKAEVEKQKRKNDIKPRFTFNGGQGSGANFTVTLQNNGGGKAENVKIKSVNTNMVVMNELKEGTIIESGQMLTLNGMANPATTNNMMASQVSCQILISFTNADGDKYLQNISKMYSGYQVGNPYEDNN